MSDPVPVSRTPLPLPEELLPVQPPPPPVRVTPLGVIALSAVTVFCLALLAGVTFGLASRPAPDPAAAVEAVAAKLAIGPEGGTVPFEGGRIEIPPGAVDSPVAIVVRRVDFDAVRGAVAAATRTVWELHPQELRFQVPVRIVFPVPDPERPAQVFVVARDGMRPVDGIPDLGAATVSVYTFDLAFRDVAPPPPTPEPEPVQTDDQADPEEEA